MSDDMLRGMYIYLRLRAYASHWYAVDEVASTCVKYHAEESVPNAMAGWRDFIEGILTDVDRYGTPNRPYVNHDRRPGEG